MADFKSVIAKMFRQNNGSKILTNARKKTDKYVPYTSEETAKIQAISRLPLSMQQQAYKSDKALSKRVAELTPKAIEARPFVGGAINVTGQNLIKKLESATGQKLDTKEVQNSALFKAGSLAGEVANFALTGGMAGGAVAGLVTKGKELGTLAKLGANVTGDVLASTPYNLTQAAQTAVGTKNPEKEFAKNFAINTALDVGIGGAINIVPLIAKALKKVPDTKVVGDALEKGGAIKDAAEAKAQQAAKNLTQRKLKPSTTITQPLPESQMVQPQAPITPTQATIPPQPLQPQVQPSITEPTKKYRTSDLAETSPFDVNVPDGKSVPQYLKTARPFITEESQASIKESLDNGVGLWTKNSMKKVQEDANKRVLNLTVNKAENMKNAFLSNTNPTLKSDAEGISLASYFDAIGDTKSARDIHLAVSEHQSNAGSLLNASKLIQRLTSEGRKQLVFNLMYKLEKQHSKILKGKELEISGETLKKLENATTNAEIDDALSEAGVELYSQIDASLLEKIDGIRRTTMLFNPKTWIKNILANVIFVPIKAVKNVVATGLEAGARATGVMTEGSQAFINPLNPEDIARLGKAKEIFKENEKTIMRSSRRYNENVRPSESPLYKSKVMNWFEKNTGMVLEKGDELILSPSFQMAFAKYLKANGLNPNMLTPTQTDRAYDVALEEALRGTFRDNSKASQAILKIKKVDENSTPFHVGFKLLLDSVLPFVKTPINVTRRAFDYSPVGIAGGVIRLLRGAKSGNADKVIRGIDNMASGLTGTGIMALGAYLYSQGVLNGRLPYDSEGNFQRSQGEQGYSINVGNGTFTVDWATPSILPLLVGVEYAKRAEQDGLKFTDIADSIADMASPVMELSFMAGALDIIQSVKQRESAGETAMGVATALGTSYAGQFIPTLAGQVARATDETRRSTTSTEQDAFKRGIDKWVKKQQAKIPIASKQLEPFVDVWGREQTSGATERILENFISPGFYTPTNVTPVDEEINSVFSEVKDSKVLPKSINNYDLSFNGGKFRMSEQDLTNISKLKGKESYDTIQKLINTEEYSSMSANDKAKSIAEVYKKSKELGKINVLIDNGKDEWEVYTDKMTENRKDYAEIKASGITPKQYYYLFDGRLNLDRAGTSPKQTEAFEALNSMPFTTEQKRLLWNKIGKDWKNNPYEDGGTFQTEDALGVSDFNGIYIPSVLPPKTVTEDTSKSESGSSSSKTKAVASAYRNGLATKQVNALKNLTVEAPNLSSAEIKAIIKMLSA